MIPKLKGFVFILGEWKADLLGIAGYRLKKYTEQ